MFLGNLGWNDLWWNCNSDSDTGHYYHAVWLGQGGRSFLLCSLQVTIFNLSWFSSISWHLNLHFLGFSGWESKHARKEVVRDKVINSSYINLVQDKDLLWQKRLPYFQSDPNGLSYLTSYKGLLNFDWQFNNEIPCLYSFFFSCWYNHLCNSLSFSNEIAKKIKNWKCKPWSMEHFLICFYSPVQS